MALSVRGRLFVIHFAFMTAILIYFLLLFMLPAGTPQDAAQANALILGLGVVAASSLVGGLVFPMISKRFPASPQLTRSMQQTIISDAFFEAIGIFGLIGYILCGHMTFAMMLMLISLMALSFNTMRVRGWIESEDGHGL